MIPGQNILNMAFTLIAKQCVQYFKFTDRRLNGVGQYTANYEEPVQICGSWQPVPRQLYMQFGLNLQKDYYTFYASNNSIDIARDVSGDQLTIGGRKYQVESANDWFAIDGWEGVLCVYQGAAE